MALVADKAVLTLDANQRKAVAAGDGAFLVIAGPGSGKTRVLTEREVRLIQEGLPPSSILAITFAKNASLEMAARVSERARVPEDELKRSNCTFHALGYRILRRNSEHLPFELAANPVALGLTRVILKEICRDPYLTEGESIEYKMAKKYISLAKRAGQTPEESGKEGGSQILPGIYKEYEKRKQERGLIDFDDMVFLAWRLLLTNPGVRQKESGRYKYVMVDEFHDTDRVQLQTAMILSEPENNFFAVADVNQSLYGWRGADPSIVVNFDKIYPVHERIILGRNYRSLPPIIDLYAEVIRPSPLADEKFLENIEAFREGHSAISFHEFDTDIGESVWLGEQVEADRANGFKMAAVLVRTNNQLRLIEQELYGKSIPYIIEGSSSFFSRVEVKGALAFLRIMENPSDDEALESIIRSPAECSRYLGNAFVNELKAHSAALSISLFDGLRSIRCKKRWQSEKAVALRLFIDTAGNRCRNKPVSEQISFILDESGLMQKLEEDEELDESGDNLIHDNLQELVRSAEPFGSARKTFLAYTESLTAGANRKYKSDDFPIRLMTVHKAKGLEFQTVYVAGVSQDILPHKKAMDIDEERRILYVAVSRAEDRLFISSFGNPSVFVKSKFPKKAEKKDKI